MLQRRFAWQRKLREQASARQREERFRTAIGVDAFEEVQRLHAWLQRQPVRGEILRYMESRHGRSAPSRIRRRPIMAASDTGATPLHGVIRSGSVPIVRALVRGRQNRTSRVSLVQHWGGHGCNPLKPTTHPSRRCFAARLVHALGIG